MKIVVTGGAGYIGSVASHRLCAQGHNVVVVDNLTQGHAPAIPTQATLETIDVVDRDKLATLFTSYRPDAVLHFAALTIAPDSVKQPDRYWRVNALGTLHLLDAMRAAGVPILVASSTAAVYGASAADSIPECAPLAPINPYGASKLAAELAIRSYGDAYGIAHSILRYFNVAGAAGDIGEDHRPETHLIPSAIEAARGARGALTIFGTDFPTGDGTAIRDYVHVEDLVDAHLLALECLMETREPLPALNLGTREGASVKDVINAVERVTGRPVPVDLGDRRPGDPAILIAESSRARDLLQWEPRRSTLDEMVSSAWQWRQKFPDGYAEGA